MFSEVDLVDALKRKNPKAFEQLMAQRGSMLYRVASRFAGREEAEDVLQETLLSVYEKIHTFDGRANLSTWLYRVVVNVALMRQRARSRSREESWDFEGPQFTDGGEMVRQVKEWSVSPENDLLRREALAVLQRAIDALPDTYRTVYALAEIEGLPHQEVAEMLKLSTGAVKTRVHRARLFLRQTLGDYFGEDRDKQEIGGSQWSQT